MTEKEKFNIALQERINNGLKDFRVTRSFNNDPIEEEAFYAEMNRMYAAPDMPDPEILGEYSPTDK